MMKNTEKIIWIGMLLFSLFCISFLLVKVAKDGNSQICQNFGYELATDSFPRSAIDYRSYLECDNKYYLVYDCTENSLMLKFDKWGRNIPQENCGWRRYK